jgi:hypothetical protein
MARIRLLSFSKNNFWLLALTVITLRALPGPAGFLAYVMIAAWGVRGGRHVIEALMLSWFVAMANSAVFGDVTGGSIGRYLVLFSVSIAEINRYFARRPLRVSFPVMVTLLLGSFIMLHSLMFSAVVLISLLKGLLWTMTTLAVLMSASKLSEIDFAQAERHLYGFLVLILALSMPVYLTHPGGSLLGYGFLRGMLGHSQAMGVMGGLVAIWAFSRLLQQSHGTAGNFGVLLLALVTVFLSATRTGLLSALLAMLAMGILALLQGQRPLKRLVSRLRNPIALIGMIVLIFGVILNYDNLIGIVSEFITKNTESISLVEAYDASRGGLIEDMWANIRRDPFVGLGFGIASDPESMVFQRVAGIPIGAPVEKGVTHVAIWEELGLIGLVIVIFWMVIIFSKSIGVSLTQSGLLIGIFLQNFGEATLFSVGGMGLLQIIIIGYCSYRQQGTVAQRRRNSLVPQQHRKKQDQC